MKRSIITALCTLALYAGFAFAQTPLTVKMPGSNDVVVAPRQLAVVTGLEISDNIIGPLEGEPTLAGYFLELDGRRCQITQVTPDGIVFLVPEAVALGRRPLYIQGPLTSRFVDVQVERFWPILDEQSGFAVAAAGMLPILYIGEPIPVGPTHFNYISLLARGFLTGLGPLQWPLSPIVVLEREGERHEIPIVGVHEVPGFPGTERVTFFAPSSANGEYHVSVVYAGYVTQSALIRFRTDCLGPFRIERGVPIRIWGGSTRRGPELSNQNKRR